MGTQDSGFPPIAFSSTFPQQTFRLVELPPELVALIEARNETRPVRLQFKSTSQPASLPQQHNGNHSSSTRHRSVPAGTAAPEGFLHLCSDDKVWAVKQVSTSNTVFVTTTCNASADKKDPDGDFDMHDADGTNLMESENDISGIGKAYKEITTIAQVKSILELLPVEPSEESVREQLLSMVHSAVDTNGEDTDPLEEVLSTSHGRPSYSFRQVLDNIPAPSALCCRVAKDLFLIHDPTAQNPSQNTCLSVKGSLLLSAWKEFMQQCVILGCKIGELKRADATTTSPSQDATFGSVFQQLDEQHEHGSNATINEFPSTLVRAILRRFRTSATPATAPLAPEHETAANILDDDWNSEPLIGDWDAQGLTVALGQWELQRLLSPRLDATTTKKDIRCDSFLDTHWKDLVPDTWHPFCRIDALLDHQSVESKKNSSNDTRHFGGSALELYKQPVKDEFGITEEKEFIRVAGTGPSSMSTLGLDSGAPGATTRPSSGGTASLQASDDAASAAAKTQKKRKWHEKFGAQRNAAAGGGGAKK